MLGDIKDANYMTKTQCAEFLGVTVRTVENWMRFRALPHVKIGKVATLRKTEVIAWLNAIPSVTRGEAEHWKHRNGAGWRVTPRPNGPS